MDREKFGVNIKIERMKHQMTQEQLGSKLNMSRAMIDRLENGREIKLGFSRIKNISEALECDLSLLLRDTGVVDTLFSALSCIENSVRRDKK